MKAGKAWGETRMLFSNHAMEMHRIDARAGGFSSVHLHQHKHNGFYVERGELLVKVWQPSGTLDETRLAPGDTMSVPPGVKHQFVALTDAVAFEAYWPAALGEDIVRSSVGGNQLTTRRTRLTVGPSL